MFRYFDFSDSESSLRKDETYSRIMGKLDEFIDKLPAEDKKLLSRMISECYLKYRESILMNTEGEHLMVSLLMAMLTEQNKKIEKMKE